MITSRTLAVTFVAGAAIGWVAHSYRVATNLDYFARRIREAMGRREQLLREEGIAPSPSVETAPRAER